MTNLAYAVKGRLAIIVARWLKDPLCSRLAVCSDGGVWAPLLEDAKRLCEDVPPHAADAGAAFGVAGDATSGDAPDGIGSEGAGSPRVALLLAVALRSVAECLGALAGAKQLEAQLTSEPALSEQLANAQLECIAAAKTVEARPSTV